jgi:acetyl-CoA C-acetyltransferase
VASGACDIVWPSAWEKLKDIGYADLPEFSTAIGTTNALWFPNLTAPGGFAMTASGYAAKYGLDIMDVKRAMAHVSVKSHANGARNAKAHLRKPSRTSRS